MGCKINLLVTSIFLLFMGSSAPTQGKTIELTFELRDREKQCFHEEIQAGTEAALDFQVLHGGDLDIDAVLFDSSKKILYAGQTRKYDTHQWNATQSGEYTFCFSNEFSAYSHKLLWFELRIGKDDSFDDDMNKLPDTPETRAAMDEMKFTLEVQTIHQNLNSIEEAQTIYRINEALQRKRAQDLNSRVLWWSAIESVAFILVGVLQVWVVKGFFSRQQAYCLEKTKWQLADTWLK